MENLRSNENPKIDWAKKGRGWIPDIPNLQDYSLDHENIRRDQRLRTEEVTGTIEGLTGFLSSISSKLNLTQKETNDLSELRKSFSGIYIAKLKIYTTLRQPKEKERQIRDRVSFDENSNKSLFSNQLAELKSYLNFLVLEDYLPLPSDDLKEQIFADFSDLIVNNINTLHDPKNNAEWLGRNEFDCVTKQIVMLFQLYSHIRVDGIVGFESYTTLNECFSDTSKLNSLKNFLKEYKNPTEEYEGKSKNELLQMPSQKKIKLQTVPISLPCEVFSAFFTELQKVASEQLLPEQPPNQNKEHETIKNRIETSFSDELFSGEKKYPHFSNYLKKILGNSYEEYSPDDFSRNIYEGIEEEGEGLFEEVLNKNKVLLSNLSEIIEVAYENFYMIEPVISMVFKVVSPLANYKRLSIKEIVSLGFQRFQQMLHKSNSLEQLSRYSEDASKFISETVFKHDLEDLEEQAQEAVKKTRQLFHSSTKQILEDTTSEQEQDEKLKELEKLKRLNCTLLFHLLIEKCLNYWLNLFDEGQVNQKVTDTIRFKQVGINQSNEKPNRFDKEEFFVIQSIDWNELPQQNEQAPPKKVCNELFQTGELVIPVSDSFLDPTSINMSLKSLELPSNSKDQKLYFFLPGFVDLSFWCPEIRDQGSVNSCTAFAGTTLFEYFVNRSSGQYEDVSSLFLYKATRQLMEIKEDTGASVRDTMKAMALFGIPPEESWPYQEENVDKEPPPFCYAYAKNFEALKYFRLDYADIPKDILLFEIKAILTAGFPCMFGFTLYSSAFKDPNPQNGYIPFPDAKKDKIVDGHAVVAVGYDDNKRLRRANPEEPLTQGAILIKNSWGPNWGKQGYGWLPYEYVLEGLTSAWWSLLKADWFKGDNFGLGGKGGDGSGPSTDQKGSDP